MPESPVIHPEDPSWRVGGKAAYLMAFDTDEATVYQIRPQHRHEEVQEVLPPDYEGVMVTDRGRSYEAHAFDDVTIPDLDIGAKIAVGAGFRIVLLALEARPRGAVRTLGIDGRARRRLDPRSVRRMVAVGVGDEDMRHRLAADSIEQRFRMRLVVGAGIDDGDVTPAYDVAHRAGEGERARIVAENPPHAGTRLVDGPRLERKVAVERDVVIVGHGKCP